jgi:hypothetical protein
MQQALLLKRIGYSKKYIEELDEIDELVFKLQIIFQQGESMFNRKNLILFFTILIFLFDISSMAVADGWSTLEISKTISVGGKEIKAGQYDVIWKSGSPQAEITFHKGKYELKVPCKIVENDKKSDHTSFTVGKDSSGHDCIKTIQFSGKKIQIEFE